MLNLGEPYLEFLLLGEYFTHWRGRKKHHINQLFENKQIEMFASTGAENVLIPTMPSDITSRTW